MPRLGKTKNRDTSSAVSSIRSFSSRDSQQGELCVDHGQRDAGTSAVALTYAALDVVRQMLLYLDPDAASLLPLDHLAAAPALQAPIPISRWNVLFSTPVSSHPSSSKSSIFTPSVEVLSYPTSDQNLFCVRSKLDVDAKQFWTLMAESGNRHLWDTTTQEGSNHRFFSSEIPSYLREHDIAKSLSARLEYLRFGSIFMVAKPRDMILLSADVRLPPTNTSALRLVSACRSQVDPDRPPVKGYTRYELGVGGFMVEELTDPDSNGTFCQVTQLSNLGAAAAWVPASVVRMVAQTLVPRSIALISKAARAITVPETLKRGVAPGDTDPKDEVVYKGKEKWSKLRPLPPQAGHGVLGVTETSSHCGRQPQRVSIASVKTEEILPTATRVTASTSSSSTCRPNSETMCDRSFGLDTSVADQTESAICAQSTASLRSLLDTKRRNTHSAVSLSSGESVRQSINTIDEMENTSDSQDTPMTESGTSSPVSGEGKERLRLIHADEVTYRLRRISVALQADTGNGEEGNGVPYTSVVRLSADESVTTCKGFGNGDTSSSTPSNADIDEDEEVNKLLAEALSISLSSPHLQSQFAAQSPRGASSIRPLSPSSPTSSGSKRARREASQLSAILLSGSDALVSALAPGARGIHASDDLARQPRREELKYDAPSSSSTKYSPAAPKVCPTSNASLSRPVALLSSKRKERVDPPGLSRAVTQTTPAHALRFPAGRDDSLPPQGGCDVALTSWKNALNSTPYALELGKMAMLWTSETVNMSKSVGVVADLARATLVPESDTQRYEPPAHPNEVMSPAVQALRSASGHAKPKSRCKPPTPGRSFSCPAH